MLLGYIFEPWLNICALGTAGSVMNIGSTINGCSHTKNPVWREKTRLTCSEGCSMCTDPSPPLSFFLRGGGSVHGLAWCRSVRSLVSVTFVLGDFNFILVLNLWNIVSNNDDLSRVKYLCRSLNIWIFLYLRLFISICIRKNYAWRSKISSFCHLAVIFLRKSSLRGRSPLPLPFQTPAMQAKENLA